MTRSVLMGFAVVTGLGGCLPINFVAPSVDKAAAKPVEPPRHAIRPPVTAGQINGNNAQEKATALRDELDRDLERAIDAADGRDKK